MRDAASKAIDAMNFAEPDRPTRRQFVHRAASLVAAPAVALTARAAAEGAVETSPGEDLMREHGVLKRVMLIYEEVLRHFEKGGSVSPDLIRDAAKIIRAFIEDYHEKLEEGEATGSANVHGDAAYP